MSFPGAEATQDAWSWLTESSDCLSSTHTRHSRGADVQRFQVQTAAPRQHADVPFSQRGETFVAALETIQNPAGPAERAGFGPSCFLTGI